MSTVTSITLIVSLCEPPEAIDTLAKELFDLAGVRFSADLSDLAGGNKHPQTFIYSAGVNRMDCDGLMAAFRSVRWEVPEQAIMVLITEDDPAVVVRGDS